MYSSLAELADAVAGAEQGGFCMCPMAYMDDLCPTDGPAVTIEDGQEIIISCSPLPGMAAGCHFHCADTIFHVKSGANFTLWGQNTTLLTGGDLYSRVVVDAGGTAQIAYTHFYE